MLNKYVYAESTQDYWPQIKTISAKKFDSSGGEGIEPPTAVPKTDVLPLHQPPVLDFL